MGAMVGGLLLDYLSVTATFAGSSIIALAAVLVAFNGKRLSKPRA